MKVFFFELVNPAGILNVPMDMLKKLHENNVTEQCVQTTTEIIAATNVTIYWQCVYSFPL